MILLYFIFWRMEREILIREDFLAKNIFENGKLGFKKEDMW